jgi:hypothetical protein
MKSLILVACALATSAYLGACTAATPPDPLLSWDNSNGSSSGGSGGSGDAGGASSSSSGGSSSGGSSSGGSGSGGSSSGGSSSSGGAGTLPCDVATLFAAHCTTCHANPPQQGSLSSLITYSDLMAVSKEDATKNEAQLSLSRMQNAQSPMPPASVNDPATAAEITTLQNWINAGYPKGSCADAGPPPSGVFQGQPPYQAPGSTDQSHNAGKDCLSCHNGQGDPELFAIGGTIFDGNNNPVVGAEVRLVDANNVGFSVYSDQGGNFHSKGSFVSPAHVGARNAQNTSDMVATITYGGCNKCHCTGGGCTTTPIHLP